jgi:hypothetical protein
MFDHNNCVVHIDAVEEITRKINISLFKTMLKMKRKNGPPHHVFVNKKTGHVG